jgi:hypothetical protein
MKKLIVFSLTVIALFTGVDCKDEPVQPPTNNDTTSHNFSVLRVDTLGTMFSFANGVDIVDENNIWVAGMFTERDTNGEILYNKNLAHWDGVTWTMISVPMMGYNNTGPDPQELKAVKVFNDSNIFVISKYNSHARWDGKKWISYYVEGKGILDVMWVRSSDDIYFVGAMGSATHWDGQTFTKINTGLTNPSLLDVWGDDDAVYAVGKGQGLDEGFESVFLSGNSGQLNVLNKYVLNSSNMNNPNFLGGMNSVFRASRNSKLWILGGWGSWKVYEIESLLPFKANRRFDFPDDYPAILIRGTADNNLYVPSSLNGEFYHFNGNSWTKFSSNVGNLLTFQFAVEKNIWVMVGSLRNGVGTAVIAIGKHD